MVDFRRWKDADPFPVVLLCQEDMWNAFYYPFLFSLFTSLHCKSNKGQTYDSYLHAYYIQVAFGLKSVNSQEGFNEGIKT